MTKYEIPTHENPNLPRGRNLSCDLGLLYTNLKFIKVIFMFIKNSFYYRIKLLNKSIESI